MAERVKTSTTVISIDIAVTQARPLPFPPSLRPFIHLLPELIRTRDKKAGIETDSIEFSCDTRLNMPILVLLVLHLISREMKECRKGGPLIPFLGGVRQREDKLRRNGNCGFVIGGDLDEREERERKV